MKKRSSYSLRRNLASLAILAAHVSFAAFAAVGCSSEAAAPDDQGANDVAITSNSGKLFDFGFKGEVIAASDTAARAAIVSQLAYVQGALTTDVKGNAQVGLVTIVSIDERSLANGKKSIHYEATLPVIWPKATATPRKYTLVLPRDVTTLDAFNRTYDGSCGKNEYGQETFWHDFNPKADGCTLAEDEVERAQVTIKKSAKQTKDKYPEYDKMLADDSIDVVAVFGIISSNTPSDEGAVELENVTQETLKSLQGGTREDSGNTSTVIKSTHVTGKVTVAGKVRTVNFTGILVQELASAGSDFDAIYGPASEKADLIIYSGHSGLGKNINSLAARTTVSPGKYQIAYLNGCQTFAYLGTALHDKKVAANGAADDPNGSKFLDVVANALPAYGDNGTTGLLLYRAILDQGAPKTYNDLLESFSPRHLVAVFGEDDNTYAPR